MNVWHEAADGPYLPKYPKLVAEKLKMVYAKIDITEDSANKPSSFSSLSVYREMLCFISADLAQFDLLALLKLWNEFVCNCD